MNTPQRLDNEGEKAYNAFDAYVQMGEKRSQLALGRRLAKSRQLISRWSSKFDWKARIAAQQRVETQMKINAETKAVEKIATITESEKATAWRAAFLVAARFLNSAATMHEAKPVAAAALARAAFTIIESVRGGVTQGFSVNVGVVNQAAEQYPSLAFDADGKPIQGENLAMAYEEALAIMGKPSELPCDNWNPDSVHATPVPPPPPEEPPERTVPSRMDTPPTSNEPATLPSAMMYDNVSIIERARSVAGP
jgi:hypothetical protein